MNPGELGDLIGAISHVWKNKMKILYLTKVFVKDLGHRYKVSYVSGVRVYLEDSEGVRRRTQVRVKKTLIYSIQTCNKNPVPKRDTKSNAPEHTERQSRTKQKGKLEG